MAQIINEPPVPFVGPIKGGFTPGSMIRIQGEVPKNADRFNVNLHCGSPPSDVALHLSVRLMQGYIARNSLQNDDWGDEEGDGNLPIAPGQHFEILILCDPGSYKIAVNGQHFCEFVHRMPFNKVSHLEIDGKVELGLIAFEEAVPAPPPPQHPPPPQRPPPVSDFVPGYGPPPPPGNYIQGFPPQEQFGGGSGQYPHHPQEQKEGSGFESFLGNAGTAIAGAMVSGLAENFLSSLTGGGGQGHQSQRQQQPMHQPQQPQFQGGHQGGQQLQGNQPNLIGDLLDSLTSEMFKPSRRN